MLGARRGLLHHWLQSLILPTPAPAREKRLPTIQRSLEVLLVTGFKPTINSLVTISEALVH